jgi:PAS domain S-box-containing protein
VATTRPTRPAGKRPGAPDGDSKPTDGAHAHDEASGASPASPASPTLHVDAILQRAVEEAARLLRSDGAMAYLLDAEGVLRFAHDAGITDDRRRSWVRSLQLEVGVGLFGRAVATGEVTWTGDYPNDPSFVHFADADRLVADLAIHSFVVAPLVSGGRTFGAMGTFTSRVDALGDAEIALVRALADHAAAAMANADLIEELGRSRADVQRRADAERALREIGGRIIALRHSEEVLQRTVDEAARLLGADGARIDVLDEASGGLYWAYDATTGRRPGLGPIAGSGEAKSGEGISGRAVRELRPVFTGDYLNDDRFEHAEAPDEHVRKYAIRSVVAVPLLGDRGPLGTLTVYTSEEDAFDEDDANIIQALAGQAAIAMTNARLIEELDRSRAAASRQADAERALREIAARITAIRDPADLLQHVVDEAARLLGAARARIDLVVPAAGRVGFTHVPGAGDVIGGAAVDEDGRPFEYGASGKAIATGRTVVSTDYMADTGFEHDPRLDEAVRQDAIRSLIVTPMTGEEGLLGVLQVGWPEPGAFEPDEVALVEALAHQAAIAIQNARLIEALAGSREEIRRRARAEQALREIATRITAIRDPGDLLQQVVEAARGLLDAERAQLDLVEPDTGLIRSAYVAGEGAVGAQGPSATAGLPGDQGINGPAIATRRAIVTGDYLTDDRFTHVTESDDFVRDTGLHSTIAAPLFTDDGLLGVIKVATVRRDAYDDEDAALIEAFADQAVVAIQNARLIDALGRSREEIGRRADAERSLRQIAANISAIRDPDAVLQQTVDEARRLLDSDAARIDLLDGDTLSWAYASGELSVQTRAEGRDLQFRLGEGIAGLAVQRGESFRTDDYLADERFRHVSYSDELVVRTGYRSVLSAPMRGEHGSLGAISVSSSRPSAYNDAQADLLQALADQAAITIQNARLIIELNRSRTELRRRAEEEQSLREIAARISATKGARDVLQRTVDEAARLLDAEEARIDLIDAESGLLRWAYHSATTTPTGTWDWPDEPDESLDQGVSGRAVMERRVAFTGDYLNDDSFVHSSGPDGFVREIGIKSVMSAPLLGEGGRPFGALTIYTKRAHAWGADDARIIDAIAIQAAIAITNQRLIEELDKSSSELARKAEAEQSLREIAARITAIREPGPLLQQVVDAARRIVGGDGSILDLVDPGGTHLRFAYDSGVRDGFTDEEIGLLTIPIGVGATGLAVAEDRVVVAADNPASQFPESKINDRFFEVTEFRSMIVAPITGESGPLGALEVYSARPDAFDDEDAALIRSLAYQAAVAITNARLIEELDRSRGELARKADAERSLREIGNRLTAIRESGDLLQHVVDEAVRLLETDGAVIDLIDPATGNVLWAYDSGLDSGVLERWQSARIGEDLVRRALEDRATIFCADYLADERFPLTDERRAVARTLPLRSVVIAPLLAERGALGTLSVYSDRPGAFGQGEADLLGALADQAALAVSNARLIEQLDRSRGELAHRADTERSLRDITARITSLRDPAEILARVVEESRRLLASDGAHLTRISEDGTYLVPVIVAGGMDDGTEAWLKQMQFPLGGGINGLAAEEIEPVWTADYRTDPRIPHEPEDELVAERLGLRSMAAAPLRAPAGEVIGTLAISYREPREIVPDELDLLQGLADQAAIALTNSNLYELLGESEARYRHLVQNSPDLIWSIDAEARFTFVSDTCERLTGWRPEDLLGKHFGALVHESSRDVAELDWTADMTEEFQELRGRLSLLHRNGHAIPAEFSAYGTLDAHGRFAGANGSVRDMSDRDRLERELRESEERYRFLVENAPDMIFSIDPQGRFVYVSESIQRALGYRPDEVIGRPFRDIIFYDDPSQAGSRWAEMEADPTLEITSRLMLIHKDGRHIPFEASSRGVVVDGAFAGVHGSARDVSDRERLERELRESEERYRFLVENSPDILFSIDRRGRLSYISESSELVTGRTPEESIGHPFIGFVAPEDAELAASTWDDLNAEPSMVRTVRIRLLTAGGTALPFEVSMIGVEQDGRFMGVQGVSREISERERLERELRESEERYRFLVENSPDVVFSTDAEGRYTYYSETVESLTGYRPAELVGQHFASIVDLDTFPDVGEAWQRFVDRPTEMQVNRFSLRDREGRRVPVEVSAIGMTTVDGSFSGIHGSARDIRERERLERELRASEERYRYLVKASPDVVWAVDEDGVVTFMSDRIESLTGFAPEEIVGKHFAELTDDGSIAATNAAWDAVRRDPTGVYPLPVHLRRRSGDPVPVEVWVTGMLRDEEFAGAHGSIRDMREREGYERDLRRQAAELASSQERAHLARELHDSVTQALFSMTLVTRTTELLVDRDPEAAKEKLGSLRDLQREALAEMRALIFELRPGNIEQDGLLPALKTHTAALQGRIGLPIVVTSDLGDRLPIVVEEVLYRISQEALHNIVKHAGARQVTLAIEVVDGAGVRLRIVDDGKGFDPAAVPDGHLGLAGMRARAEKIGAAFTVDARPGSGTTIEVVVPEEAIDRARAAAPRTPSVSSAE